MAPRWDLFAGIAVVTVVLLLAMARSTRRALFAEDSPVAPIPPRALLANVALVQGLFGAFLAFAAWYAEIPPPALGLGGDPVAGVAAGIGLGVALAGANEAAVSLAARSGRGHDDRLRSMLAPATPAGWVALLGVALPVVAVVEEFLFRAALIGGLAAGYGVSPWWLAIASSALFGAGHGAQGSTGIAATSGLGFVLAAAFVVTDSLLAVVVAHYLVNAVEFVVHEGIERG